MTKHGLLLIALLVLLLATLASAMPAPVSLAAPADPFTASVVSKSASAADTLVYAANISDFVTADPGTMYNWSGILIVHNLYETLVKFEGTDYTTIKPGLAEKWSITEVPDGWEMTFNLKAGKFSTGNPITADDVVYSFQRVVALNKAPGFLFTSIASLKTESIKAKDPQTVVITLPKTASPQVFLSILTFTVGGIVDSKEAKKHEVSGDWASTWLNDHTAGSGPYMLDHWTTEVEAALTANPNYGGKAPATKNVLIKHVLESTNQQFGLEKGDIDVARSLSPEQIASLKGKPGVTSAQGDSLLLIYVTMNQKVQALTNPKVREALRWAVDYDGIIKGLLYGNARKVQTIIPYGLLGYNSDTPFQQDIKKAQQLLGEAGFGQGLTLELAAPTGAAPGGAAWADLAAKLQADWAKVGVKINIKQVPYAELYNIYRAKTHQLLMIEWGPDYADPDANASPFADIAAKALADRSSWDDPIGQKARAASMITDIDKRAAAYKEITDYVLHNGPYAVLYQPVELFGLRSNVNGFAWKPIGWLDFDAIGK